MLSKQVKERIARNKKRRIQCRTKNGRDLYRLIRSVKVRTTNQAVKFLLEQVDSLEECKTGLSQFLAEIPKGGFKRGILPVIAARRYPIEHKSNLAFNMAVQAGIPIRVSMEHDADFIMGIDPAESKTSFVTIVRGKQRTPNVGSVFDVNMDFRDMRFTDNEALLKGGGDIANIFADREAMRRVVEGVKDGNIPSITIDSFSTFEEGEVAPRGHMKSDGTFEITSWDLVNKETNHGIIESSQGANRSEQKSS